MQHFSTSDSNRLIVITIFAINSGIYSATTIECTAGTYATTATATHCMSCATGKYSTKVGATISSTCALCASGKYISTVGASSCTLCEIGKYSAKSGASNCTTCKTDAFGTTYAEYEGSRSCKYTCQVMFDMYQSSVVNGYYPCSKPESFDPLDCQGCACLAGSYYTMYSDEFYVWEGCFYCKEGKYSSISRASSCTSCEAGKYVSFLGATTCILCDAGTYTTSINTVTGGCLYCPEGKYSSMSNASACTSCAAGKYVSLLGATTCILCDAGTYTTSTNTVNCSLCGHHPICNPSEYLRACSPTSLPACLQCNDADKPLYSSWLWSENIQYSCKWVCDQGFFKFGGSTCQPCKTQTSCSTNQYVTNCNSTVDGLCLSCHNKPLNSFYTAASRLYGISDCAWSCNDGYRKNLISMTCDACPPGTYALAGLDHCTVCQSGKYSPAESASMCLDCSFAKYTPTIGASTCKFCPFCTETGKYRTGCSGTSAGECSLCTNSIK